MKIGEVPQTIISRIKADRHRLILISLLGGAFMGVAGCGPADSDFVEFDSYSSPDEKYRVVIEIAPANKLAFSPEAIRIYLVGQDTNERELVATTSLANDGGTITRENIQAEWIDSMTVRFCLSGAEQGDETLVVDVVNATFYAESVTCRI